jgi:hypothetical protein
MKSGKYGYVCFGYVAAGELKELGDEVGNIGRIDLPSVEEGHDPPRLVMIIGQLVSQDFPLCSSFLDNRHQQLFSIATWTESI